MRLIMHEANNAWARNRQGEMAMTINVCVHSSSVLVKLKVIIFPKSMSYIARYVEIGCGDLVSRCSCGFGDNFDELDFCIWDHETESTIS